MSRLVLAAGLAALGGLFAGAEADAQIACWSEPGITREEAWRSFHESCVGRELSACQADFLRTEEQICRVTRTGHKAAGSGGCDWAAIGVTEAQGRAAYLRGCDTAPPDKREACRAAWNTHRAEICRRILEAQRSTR